MSIAVTVLGSSGMFATTERAASGYLVEVDGRRIWLDAGAGTWRNLLGLIDYAALDGVILSHVHPDHSTDVFQGYHARSYGEPEPLPVIPLWAPAQVIDRVSSFAEELTLAFDPRTIVADGGFSIGEARVTLFEMAHPVETVGVRVEHQGLILAYTADTGLDGDLVTLTKDAGLLISEATLQDSDGVYEGHLSAGQAAEVARMAGVPRLVLTHLPPGRDLSVSLAQARAAAPDVLTVLAADGQRYEV